MTTQFHESIQTALANGNLTGALGRFSESYRVSRAKAYEGIDFEALRDQIATAKSDASSRFEELAGQYGVSRVRVRQIEVRAFEKLQKAMRTAATERNLNG